MSLSHPTSVAPPAGHDLSRSGSGFVLTASSSGATISQTGATGTATAVTVTYTRDQLRALGQFLLAAAD